MIKFFKRIGIIALFCISGWGLGYLYGIANLNGYFVQWVSIGKPPITPKEISSINNGVWIKATNGEIYYYNNINGCKENCWKKGIPTPSATENILSLEKCSSPKLKRKFVVYQGKCELYGPGGFHVIYYGIAVDGVIYQWEDRSAEGDAIISIIAPIMGLFLGLILSIVAVLLLYIRDFFRHLPKDNKVQIHNPANE